MIYEGATQVRNEAILVRREIRRWGDGLISTDPVCQSDHNPHAWDVDFDSDAAAEQAVLFYVQSLQYARSVLAQLIDHQKSRGIDKDKPV